MRRYLVEIKDPTVGVRKYICYGETKEAAHKMALEMSAQDGITSPEVVDPLPLPHHTMPVHS